MATFIEHQAREDSKSDVSIDTLQIKQDRRKLQERLVKSERDECYEALIELIYKESIQRNQKVQELLIEKADEVAYKRSIIKFMKEKLHFIPARIV